METPIITTDNYTESSAPVTAPKVPVLEASTPSDRLHSVEEFIEKLEHAIGERL